MGRPEIATLPQTGTGIGLRLPLVHEMLSTKPDIDFIEIIADNYFDFDSRAWRFLDEIRERCPVVVHSVGLNLLGANPVDTEYLRNLKRVADRLDTPFLSDHLCWCSLDEFHSYDLLPVPFRGDLVGFAATRASDIQSYLERPFGLENLSSYVQFPQSDLSEWDFYNAVVREAKCHYLLDINNVYVSSCNHGFNPLSYLDSIDYSRVAQIHLAGHERVSETLVIDTHDGPICKEVWDLFSWVSRTKGSFPTLIEWDEKIPQLSGVLAEMMKAREQRRCD
jgi:uncharacterized protein